MSFAITSDNKNRCAFFFLFFKLTLNINSSVTVFTAVSTFHSHQVSVHPALREGDGQVFILHGHLYSLGLVYQKECVSLVQLDQVLPLL